MGAAEGRAEQSRLAAERVQRLKRRLDQAERATKPWDEGAVGEGIVAERLRRLVPHGWFLLHDVNWPGRPMANLAHVLVGPGGVVVVDVKNWTGEVSVSGGVLWQGGFARTQSVEGALAQCAAVASVLAPPHRRLVRPLICLAGQPDLFAITNADVAVAGADRIVDAVLALPPVLDQQAVAGLYAHVRSELTQEPAAESPALRSLTRNRLVPPSTGRADVCRGSESRGPDMSRRPDVSPPPAGQAGLRGSLPGPQHFPSAARAGNGARSGYGRRKATAQQQAAAGMGRFLCFAGFVAFAVYLLPYLGR
jgi:hypothetical protein